MGDLLLAPRISPERAQPQFPSSLNATTTQVDATVKMKVSLPNSRPLYRRMDSSMEPLVLIDIIVVVATVKVIVVVLMGEFLRGDCGCARCLRTYSRREYILHQIDKTF